MIAINGFKVASCWPFIGLNKWDPAVVRDLEKKVPSHPEGCSHFACPFGLGLDESRFLATQRANFGSAVLYF